MSAITIDLLQRAAVNYDAKLRKLPFLVLEEELTKMGITLLEVDGTDKVAIFHRRGGMARPYVIGGTNTVKDDAIGKVIERELTPKDCFTALKDHVMNYQSKRVISNSSEKPDAKTKKHPLEMLILESKIRTVGEDIIDALFFAERDDDDKSPMGMFDGFNTIIDKEVTAGEITEAKGNLEATDVIAEPANDTDISALTTVVNFVRAANPMLRRRGWLYLTNDALFNVMDALGNKLKYKNAMEYDVFIQHLRGITKAPALQIISEPALGTGSRMMYTVPNNLDFGVGTRGDNQYVQVREPYEDPNIAQFWMQWKSGARVTSLHPKDFMINDQLNSSTELSGDYS